MKKLKFILINLFFIFMVLYFKDRFIFANENEIKPSPVFAQTNEECNVYYDENMNSIIKPIKKGTIVQILKDKTEEKYLIKTNEYMLKGWVFGKYLNIPKTPISNKIKLQKEQIEQYVNENGFSSQTEYFVFTDIERQQTYILKGKEKNWVLEKTIPCATGKNSSPTTRGLFKIGERGSWFYSERLGSGAKYWVRFNKSYLFHSVAMDKNKNVIDETIGERCSSGCVRMGLEDIKWFYENIPEGTTVFIN